MPENKMFTTVINKELNDDEMSVTAWANKSDSIDRSKDLIEDTAWDLTNFLKNPVVPAFHMYNRPPIGKALWAKVVPGQGLRFKVKFASTEEGSEFYQLYKEGILNAFSVGFMPRKWKDIEDFDKKDIEKYMRDGELPNRVFTDVELFEVSAVVVPDHMNALVERDANGLVKTKMVKDMVEEIKLSPEYIEIISKEINEEDNFERPKKVGFIEIKETEKVDEEIEKEFMLVGSSKQESVININGEEKQLGDVVSLAFDKSELTVNEWNNLNDNDREDLIQMQIDVMVNKEDGSEEKLELDNIIEFELEEKQKESKEPQEKVGSLDYIKEGERIQKLFNSFKNYELKEEDKKGIVSKQYGDDFDISSVRAEPYGFEYKIFTKFLKCKIKDMFTTNFLIPNPMKGNYLSAFKSVLKNHTILDERNFTQSGFEVPLKYSVVKLKSNLEEEFLIDGTRFYKDDNGENFVIQFYPTWGGIGVEFYSHKNKSEFVKSIISDSVKWVDENNLLKGEKFSISGEFLEKSNIDWEDIIFPSQKDLDTVKRNIENLSKNSNSRGMMLIGPAGTGKTQTGRVLMNKSDTTFIWASSKDFGYSATYSLGIGFEMARKLAPSVFFIEDIDSWLSDYAVDLLKTEMDGIRTNKGVLTILTSNFPEQMPEALIDRPGRFHHIINFSLPNLENRKKLLKLWCENADKEIIESFAEKTEGFSGSHLKELVDFAKMISEDEKISINEALFKSLEQMKEQRDLINSIKSDKKKEISEELEIINKELDLEIEDKEFEIDVEDKDIKSIFKSVVQDVIKDLPSGREIFDEVYMKKTGKIF